MKNFVAGDFRDKIHGESGERGGHTLQPTALVNEAYLRLVDQTIDDDEVDSRRLIKVPKPDGSTQALQTYIYNHAYASWLAPNNASLAFAISFILLWLFLLWLLFRKNIIIKI